MSNAVKPIKASAVRKEVAKKMSPKKGATVRSFDPEEQGKNLIATLTQINRAVSQGEIPAQMANEIKNLAKSIEKTVEDAYDKANQLESVGAALEEVYQALYGLEEALKRNPQGSTRRSSPHGMRF